MGHDGFLVVGGKGVVASDAGDGRGAVKVVHAVPGQGGGAGFVRVVILANVSEQLETGWYSIVQ